MAARHAVAGAPSAVRPRERRFRDERVLLFGCTALAVFALFYNVFTAPDIFEDELAYTMAARNVGIAGHLTWSNIPILTHPPLFYVLQAGWLMLTGHDQGSLLAALQVARLFSAAAAAASVLLVAGLAYRLAPYARLRRRQWLAVLVAVIAALDPVLVRYGRQVMIEPFALAASLLVLHAAWSLRNRKFQYVWVTGVLTGLALLTNEITVFIVATPILFALLQRDRSLLRRSLAAFAIGLGFMSLWFVWAVEIGIGGTFISYQTVT
ncbi:MAG: ArnT family glycosyltransferase, partial [Acidimicrobiales bacterium]